MVLALLGATRETLEFNLSNTLKMEIDYTTLDKLNEERKVA
ncbi:hypothetical protein [Halobacillus andaensis]